MVVNLDENVIEVSQLGVQYDNKVWGIKDIDVTFKKGELIALVGANGAGKSTFLNALCGLIRPTKGDVFFNKNLINRNTPFHNIGWSKQTHAIDWYLNVFDNVIVSARLAGKNRKASKIDTLAALDLVGLLEYKDRDVDALSGGQQQRVQIARAIVHQPDIMILDEPTTGLDAESSEKLLSHLKEKAKKDGLVIVSSHDLNLLDSYCDSVLLLNQGSIVAYEPKTKFISRYRDKEILTIEYEGELSELDKRKLEEIEGIVAINDLKPLVIEIKRNTPIGQIINTLDSLVFVMDINRTSPGLREAYLEVARAKEEG